MEPSESIQQSINQSINLYSLSFMIHVNHEASVHTNKHIIFGMAATYIHSHTRARLLPSREVMMKMTKKQTFNDCRWVAADGDAGQR